MHLNIQQLLVFKSLSITLKICDSILISLLQSQKNQMIESTQPLNLLTSKPQQKFTNQDLLEEVRNLKKMVSALAQKQIPKYQKQLQNNSSQLQQNINPQSELLSSKIPKIGLKKDENNSNDMYKNFKSEWKIRMTNRHKPTRQIKKDELQQSIARPITKKLQEVSESEEKKSSLDESIINKHLSFLNSRLDTDQQKPAKTQFFVPQVKQQSYEGSDLRFKKMDMIPLIDKEHSRFKSYVNTQRYNIFNKDEKNRQIKEVQTRTSLYSQPKKISSQPQIRNRKGNIQNRQSKLIKQLKYIQLKRQTSKQELIKNGKKLLKLFYEYFNEETTLFTIKKYKNCVVFSLLPAVTKAVIYHYVGDVFFGNISLDEKGRIQKSGIGLQIVKGRHLYQGHFINGKKNGRGKISYQNGDIYEGQWVEGQIYGFGRYIDNKNDNTFEGFWRKGEYCGQKGSGQAEPFQFF